MGEATLAENAEAHGSEVKFEIFRAKDSPTLEETGLATHVGMDEEMAARRQSLIDAGFADGFKILHLHSNPRSSLAYAWFKSGFPLPRHSHDGDCLYYIIDGSLRLGTEELGRGDGFFLPGGTPYTYTPGPNGVEILEFRTTDKFEIQYLAKGQGFWDRAIETLNGKREQWAGEMPPLGLER